MADEYGLTPEQIKEMDELSRTEHWLSDDGAEKCDGNVERAKIKRISSRGQSSNVSVRTKQSYEKLAKE